MAELRDRGTGHYLEALQDLREVGDLGHIFSKATQLAAISAAHTAGFGDKKGSDKVAVDVMRNYFNTLPIDGVIEVGEGEKDEAPMLYVGEKIGNGTGLKLSIAVDPLEGTDATADLMERASSVLAISERDGIMRLPNGVYYMDKLIVGPEARGKVDINAPVSENLNAIAKSLSRDVSDLNIVVLLRERNEKLIKEIREAGARVKGIKYGDLIPGVQTCASGSAVHAVMGIGGAPEAVLTAVGIKSLGGEIQARVFPKDVRNEVLLNENGVDMNRVYNQNDFASGKFTIFSATAVTDNGKIMEGVRFFANGARTSSLLICAINGEVEVTKKDSTLVVDNSNFRYRLD